MTEPPRRGLRAVEEWRGPSLAAMARRAEALCASGRAILGVAGPPGSGKSTLAAALLGAVGVRAALVPMDGFHLADAELARLGLADRKGAIDTFDAAGFQHLLLRLRAADQAVVYAPYFDRAVELAVAGAIPVVRDVALVITEGNYLLADGPFTGTRELLDECWYLEVDGQRRRNRLIQRHRRYGKTPETATAWVDGSDQANAVAIESTRDRADIVLYEPLLAP